MMNELTRRVSQSFSCYHDENSLKNLIEQNRSSIKSTVIGHVLKKALS